MTIYGDTLAETLTTTGDVVRADQGTTISQGLGISPLLSMVRAVAATATETISIAPALTASYGQVIREAVQIAFSQVTNSNRQVSISETVRMVERLLPGIPVQVAEAIGVHLDQVVQQVVVVAEQLHLQPVMVANFLYSRTIAETVRMTDALARFFGADIVETVGVADVMSVYAKLPVTVVEDVGVADAVTPVMVLRIIIDETIDINAQQMLQMIFDDTIAEGFEISAAYLSPGGGVVTWSMNTRTGAVTEYSNYAFNSFARVGNKYIGASESGLYELLGDDDDGTNIIAQIKSGFAQWAGSKFTIFKGIYLGVRGEGNFILRLITGDGKTYDYAVATRNQRTTKVHIGKGLKARYFAFELISTGQDFDLDTIEFVPIMAERRV